MQQITSIINGFLKDQPKANKIGCAVILAILALPVILILLPLIIWKTISFLTYIKVDEEPSKQDYVKRAEWLREKVIVAPDELINAMPSAVGSHYQGEWAIYSLAMTSMSLVNISKLYPEYTETYRQDIKKMIDITMSPAIQAYDAQQWGESPLESLDGKNDHMSYLSLLAWMITNYKFIGGDTEYDDLLHRICEALHRRMLAAPDLNLKTFPRTPIFIPDMMVTIVALNNYAQLYDGKYADMVQRWLDKAKTEWIDQRTGLLAAMIYDNSKSNGKFSVCGSYAGLTCYFLSLVDEKFAYQQYQCMKQHFAWEGFITGIKEYKGQSKWLDFHIDAGPLLFGYSPSGTAFAVGCATYYEDWQFRNGLLRTAELAATTIYGRKQRHYLLGGYVPVGEAITLAMKTHHRTYQHAKLKY